jgi:leader peptidase (prepilin peptidase)/N-methyltransferase
MAAARRTRPRRSADDPAAGMIDTAPPPALLIAFAAALGSVVGSFLNVCIYRLPIRKSIVWPASACTKCGHELSWYENIPILSWIALRARCRSCGAPIASRYPIVEAITGAMFAAAWWYYGPGVLLASRLVLGCMLLVLFAIDLEHHLLPNAVTLPGIVIGFLFSATSGEPGWIDSLVGILVGGGILFAIAEVYYRVRKEEGLGMGDVKMLAMIGAFIGWKLTLMTLMMASLSGTIIGVALIISRRGNMKYALPFGTFLALGAAAAATVGQPLLDWYLALWR